MGTFHDNRGELHGTTIIVDTKGPVVYVGRCDIVDDVQVKLFEADEHEDGEQGRSKQEYLERAKQFGIWKKHSRLSIPMSEVSRILPLAHYDASASPMGDEALVMPEAGGRDTQPVNVVEPAAAAQPEDASPALIRISDEARVEVRRLLSEPENAGKGLRLGVLGGGCSGLVYNLEFDAQRDGDLAMDCGEFFVYLDRKSSIYLRDVILDHQSGLQGRGFVFKNPNASNTCGCGESFSI